MGNTHQIGPQDRRQAARTRPHSDWSCALAGCHSADASSCMKRARGGEIIEPYWWCPSCHWYACDACVKDMPDKATSKQVAHWRPTECPKLDELVLDMIRDFHLPNPFVRNYTIKMNWYPDAGSRVSPHRHDNWTLLLSLGSSRVLTLDRARVLMEDGDLVLFGTQSHGVPEMPSCKAGRLSLVFMFAPDDDVGAVAGARATATASSASLAYATRGSAAPPGFTTPARVSLQAAFGSPYGGDEDEEDEAATVESSGFDPSCVQMLQGLGFHAADAISALRAADGDVEQAATILLAAAVD